MENKHTEGTKDFYASLKKGDVLYESDCELTIEVQLLEDAVLTYDEPPVDEPDYPYEDWRVTFKAKSGQREVDYLITRIGLNYNCGRLSRQPEYTGPILRLDGTTSLDGILERID